MAGQINDTGMAACCSPNPVNLVDSCYVWCTLPYQYSNKTNYKDGNAISTAFGKCITDNGGIRGASVVEIPLKNSASTTRVSLGKLATLIGFLYLIS
jgi:hypothetical protein